MMETQLKDPSCRTLLFAFKQKQHHCVLREDFKGASQAKLQAAEVTRLGRQLDACRALHKASIDSSKATSDINLDDVDAVRKIRNRKDQKMKRDVMREREEEALLNRLDVMREEAISQSRAVGVVVGLDSFLSSKQIIKDQIEEEKLILGDGNSILHDDDGMELSSLADLSSGIHIKVETYINLHAKLESTMKSWLIHSNTEEQCYPPSLTIGQKREMDFVIVLFGEFFTRMLFSNSTSLIKIAVQCLDCHLPMLAKLLGAETVFKVCVFLLTVIMTSNHSGTNGTNGTNSTNGTDGLNQGVRESVIHLCRTIFTDSEGVECGTNENEIDLSIMLFQAIDVENVGNISHQQFRNSIYKDTRVRELLLSQNDLDVFLSPNTELDLFAGYDEDGMDQDTFCERIQMISPQSPHPFHVFSKLSDDTMRVGVVGLMPHIIENIELHVEQLHVPNGCRYGTDKSTGNIYPLGGLALFDIGNVAIELDVIHQIANLDQIGIQFVMQLIWPTNSKTTTTAHLLIINSLLMTTGFIESSVLSAECILPLAVSCLFSNDHKLKWAAEHLIADVYRLEEFTIDTTAALESLQVSKIRLKLIQSRLCFEFVRLAASRDKGVATSKMIDCPKINPKDVIPQIRHMSYHLPGYLYQGTNIAQQLPSPHDEEGIQFQKLAKFGKEWGGRIVVNVEGSVESTASTNVLQTETTKVDPTPTPISEVPIVEATPSKPSRSKSKKVKKSKSKKMKKSKSKRKSKSKVAPENKS